MPRKTKLIIANKAKKRSKRIGKTSKGVRGELLPGDGETFTTLTRLPRTSMMQSREFDIVQSYTLPSWLVTSMSVPVGQGFNTALVSFANASTLAALFDQYMIDQLELWLMPQASVASSSLFTGVLTTVIDLDDTTALSSIDVAGEYESCVTSEVSQGHYRHFKPHVAIATYAGAFTSFANKANVWIDAAYPSVQHYGMKVNVTTTSVALAFDLVVKAHFRFRNVH